MALLWFPLSGCDDGDVDEARNEIEERAGDVREDAEDLAGEAGARAAAEAMRGILLAHDAGERREVAVLQDAAGDIPGDPEVTGIVDADGDGRDDDGAVTVAVGDQVSCLSVSDSGDIDVSLDAC
jgi:hypothetical protein